MNVQFKEYSKVNSPVYKSTYVQACHHIRPDDLWPSLVGLARGHVLLPDALNSSYDCRSQPQTRLRLFVQSDAAHALGLCHRAHLLNWIVSWVEEIEARSCDAVHVSDSTLGGVPARVFHPVGGGHLKRGIVYFHGGGWALGSARESDFSYRSVKKKVAVKPQDLYLQGCAHTTFCAGRWRRTWTLL